MIQDQILAEIDTTITKVKRNSTSAEETTRLYEQLGRKVASLRSNSVAYRKSERKKGARIRADLAMRKEQ